MRKQILKAAAVALSMMMLAGCGQKAESTAKAPAETTKTEADTAAADPAAAEKKAEGVSGDSTGEEGKTGGVLEAPKGFPSKNISWIVPADAGAPLDIPTRAIIDNMDIDTNIVVENIAGASNTIGALEAMNRPADGYTILTGSSSSMILQPLMVDLSYNPEDFRIISLVKPLATYAVTVGPKSPLKTAEDWEKLVKSGERFTFTVSNAGSASHLSMVDALKQMKIESGVYVPYNGGAEVTAALLNQEIDFAVLDTPAELIQAANGDVNVLLIMSDKPDPLSPETPIIADYGVTGMDAYYSLQCIAVRKDTPDDIAEYLKQQINAAIESEAYQKYLKESGVGSMAVMPEDEIEERIANARNVYKTLLEELGMINK